MCQNLCHACFIYHPTANEAWPCLVSEVRQDWECSGWYGHRRCIFYLETIIHEATLPYFHHSTDEENGLKSFFSLCTVCISSWNTVILREVQTKWGESGRAGSSLGSWYEQRQEGGALGYLEAGIENRFPQIQLVWQKDPEGEMTRHRNSVCLRYLPPSPQKSLEWIPFLPSLTKGAVSITGRGKIWPNSSIKFPLKQAPIPKDA